MPARSDLLIVFARHPDAGAVKTRLASAIGAGQAAALYAAFVEDLARRFAPSAGLAVRFEVAPSAVGFAERFGLAPSACRPQHGADLGERMRNAFQAAHDEGYARTVLIGSDAPQLGRDLVEGAFRSLARADLVLAPALDGGYALIGLREPREVFGDVPWSTPAVLESTLARARALGLRHELLDPTFDVDEPADLDRLRVFLAQNPAVDLPATRAALERLARAARPG